MFTREMLPASILLVGYTIFILFFSIMPIDISNAITSIPEIQEDNDEQDSQQIFIAKIADSKEISSVNTGATGIAIFKHSIIQNDTLEYEIVLNDINDITAISIDYNTTIPVKTLYSNLVIPDICCISSEAAAPHNYYLNGIVENDVKITPLDLIKNSISLGITDNSITNNFDDNNLTTEATILDSKIKSLIDLFESGSAFINVKTKSEPSGEIRGQVIDKVQILK
jgi:hypothetical protein